MVNPETVQVYRRNLNAHTYFKTFKTLNVQEPSDNDVRLYLQSRAHSRIHDHNFLFVDSEEMMVWRGQRDLDFQASAN